LGITDDLLKWISSFVTGRTQRTKIGSAKTDKVSLSSGAVQGSCIGPLLFILYINYVAGVIGKDCQCTLYTGDLKSYSEIKTQQDEDLLQGSLDALTRWSTCRLAADYFNKQVCYPKNSSPAYCTVT